MKLFSVFGIVANLATAIIGTSHFFDDHDDDDNNTILLSHLRELGLTDEDVSEMITTDEVPSMQDGVMHIYQAQSVKGIRVANGRLHYAMKNNKQPLFIKSTMQVDCAHCLNTDTPMFTAGEAIMEAAMELNLSYEGGGTPLKVLSGPVGPEKEMIFEATDGLSTDDIPTKLNYFIVSDCDVRLVYDIVLNINANTWLQLRVDAITGDILDTANWVNDASYSVYPTPYESPMKDRTFFGNYDSYDVNPMSLLVNPELSNLKQSPNGWLLSNSNFTLGNNVYALSDIDGTTQRFTVMNGQDTFDFRPNNLLSLDRTGMAWTDAAVTNLFYWNNIVHDVLTTYGFDEACGNFQQVNLSGDGVGSDAVFAIAQDKNGVNNAVFATPPEGINPVMRMFLWTPNIFISFIISDIPYEAAGAGFGPTIASVLAKEVVEADSDGCSMDSSSDGNNDYLDKIVLIDRGGCTFVTKVLNGQKKGAAAVIIVNNRPGPPFSLGGTPAEPITIPSVMISQQDGNSVKNEIKMAKTMMNTTNSSLVVIGNLEVNSEKYPWLDSSFDNGIIAHEYGHGLSTRLTGGPSDSSCLNHVEQAGEGWSDFVALFITAESANEIVRTIGSYAGASQNGIRNFPYSANMNINPLTYADISRGLSIPHGIGSFFATCLWDLYLAMVNLDGFNPNKYESNIGGSNKAMLLVVEGLKVQPCNPTFVDSRDAIIAADMLLFSEKYRCTIWGVFARRGLGVDATSGQDAAGQSLGTPTEDFNVPDDCPSLDGVTFWPEVVDDGIETDSYAKMYENDAATPVAVECPKSHIPCIE